MKKKVLFLITKGTWGGAQRYVYDLATSMPRDQFDVTVAYGTRGLLHEKLEQADIDTYEIPALGRNIMLISDVKSFFQIYRMMRDLRPDVVHVNSSKAGGIGAVAARLAGVPRVVFTVHGWPFKERRTSVVRGLIYLASWFTAVCSTHVIVVSKTDEREGRRMPIVGTRVRYVAIASKSAELFERDSAWGTVRSIVPVTDTGQMRIVTIAELTPNKNIRAGIDAISKLEERGVSCAYVIMGDGEEYGRIKQYIAERGMADRVFLAGFVPDAGRYLKAFDLFLLPSRKEGMPYVLLEAAHAGLPIATTTAIDPGFAELYTALRITPPSPQALADAMFELRTMSGELRGDSLATMVAETSALY